MFFSSSSIARPFAPPGGWDAFDAWMACWSSDSIALRASRLGVIWPFSQRFTVETVTPIACANSSWVMFKRFLNAAIDDPLKVASELILYSFPLSDFLRRKCTSRAMCCGGLELRKGR